MNKIFYFLIMCLFAVYSGQAQITWNNEMDVAASHFDNQHPRIALDRSGNSMVIWSKNEALYFAKSNGIAFSAPLQLNPEWMTIAGASWMGPDIASHGDTVYIVVKRTPESEATHRIFVFTSYDAGLNFENPVEIAIIGDSLSRFPTIEADKQGHPIVGYMKFNSAFQESRWVVTRSNDFGKTFTTDVKASGWGSSDAVCDCCPGAVVSYNDKTAMIYRDNNNNLRDIWTGWSEDNASTFKEGSAVDNNNWQLMSCPASGPDGVIVNDTLYSTFMSGSGGKTRTYLSKTSLPTHELVSVKTLTGNLSGLNQQNYPRLATDGKAIAIVWLQNRSGGDQLPILFTDDINKGFPLAFDTVALADIVDADVAIGNNKVFVVWEDPNSGTVKFRSGDYGNETSATYPEPLNVLNIYPNLVHSNLYYTINSSSVKNCVIKIIDINGKLIHDQKPTTESIDVSNLKNGIYFVKIFLDNHLYIKKFIKI
ncbi:MAG: T9SS type A sorting domain-containing protein [Saprospiraceae bacterium]|nr:T9SS type A sorting domain-containing protein [Candidatus Brachybacter algidus]